MLKTDAIARLLNNPSLVEADHKTGVQDLIERYPYFVPARYLQSIIIKKEGTYSDYMLRSMRLYSKNWLLFHEMLEHAADPEGYAARVDDRKSFQTGNRQYHTQEAPNDIRTLVSEEKLPNKITEEQPKVKTEKEVNLKEEDLIAPLYTENYFQFQGEKVSEELPDAASLNLNKGEQEHKTQITEEEDKSLMRMMSFSDWLLYYKKKTEAEKEEEEGKKALKALWQKEKLASVMEEDSDEIPENVFNMAVNSIEKEEDLASESLAQILLGQKKYDKALEMYKKLSLRNPQKSHYFATQIQKIQNERGQ